MDLNNTKSVQHKVKLWKLIQITKYFFEILFLVLLGGCSILNPSILSFNYFFILLFILTWFGFNKQFTSFYVYLRMLVCVISVAHLLLLFVYQFDGINSIIESDKFLPRLFGLTQYTTSKCEPFFQGNDLNFSLNLTKTNSYKYYRYYNSTQLEHLYTSGFNMLTLSNFCLYDQVSFQG